MVSLAQAVTLAVNDEVPLQILSPGFSYVTSQAGEASALSVTTAGYLFCANVISDTQDSSVVTLAPSHPRWTLPEAFLKDITYSGGALLVNRSPSGLSPLSTLVCHARRSQGEIANPFSAYGNEVFLNGFEGLEATQYASMVNWQPVQGFDWAEPDWSQVPTDACNFDMTSADTPFVEEQTLCAAATGVRPGDSEFGTRAATMWTATSGASFIYLARVDTRLGPQESRPDSQFGVPERPAGAEGLPTDVSTEIRDGFDSQYLSASGSYCFLTELPATLNTNVCNGAVAGGPLPPEGTLHENVVLSLFPPSPTASFYVAVIRTTIPANPPSINTPIAAIAVMSDPGTAREDDGDAFLGDNVIFGFPNNGGFPWMTQ